MRKIIVSNYVSLDGFIAGPEGEIDWFVWDEEMAKYSRDLLYSIDTLLFGRVTYELMAGYWPTASPPSEEQVIIDAMNNLPKIVFSRTLARADWTNTTLVKEINKEEILKMKQQPGMDMVIFGSGSIVSAFSQLALIDEYRIIVNPVVLGRGKPFFKDIRERINLKLLKTKTFSSNGNVVLYYGQAG
ncbi:MAG: dihydrofolate reductase family protein [bacterium]